MRQTTITELTFRQTGIQLSAREMSTLRAASRIAEKAREMARDMDGEFEDHWLDLSLAGIEHPPFQDFADGFLPVMTVGRHWSESWS